MNQCSDTGKQPFKTFYSPNRKLTDNQHDKQEQKLNGVCLLSDECCHRRKMKYQTEHVGLTLEIQTAN